METSVITDHDQENEIGLDVSCNLGSIDIHNATKEDNFGELVEVAIRLLTSVSDMTDIVNVPSVSRANKEMHSVGLGAMNLHGHFVSQGIMYGSPESIEFTSRFFEALDYFSVKASVQIAKEKEENFYGYEGSMYQTGEYVAKRLKGPKQTSEKVLNALGKIPVITDQMWQDLQQEIDQYGLYHSYLRAIAP